MEKNYFISFLIPGKNPFKSLLEAEPLRGNPFQCDKIKSGFTVPGFERDGFAYDARG